MTWLEVCNDPKLHDLPYKIELNRWGHIEMSPHRKEHGVFQSRVARLLEQLLPDWIVAVECAVSTSEGVKVADVAAVSPARWDQMGDLPACPVAPEICVEVMSFSNSLAEMEAKRTLYFGAGATEVWICEESGALRFFDQNGQLPTSRICPEFPQRVKLRGR